MDDQKAAGAGEAAAGTEPQKGCGINGCTTWYDDPAVMQRHLLRVHSVGAPSNLNKPKPRDQSNPGDPELVRSNDELEDRHELTRPSDWGRTFPKW